MLVENKNIYFLKHIEENFSYIKGENIVIFYIGEVNHEMIKALLYTLESYFYKTKLPKHLLKKTFNILVECIQNIEKHTHKLINHQIDLYKKGSMLIANFESQIHILSSNIIVNDQKIILEKKEKEIKGKTKDQLREMYKKQLIEGTISEKGGAGLGFIDIARKTNNNVRFNYHPISEDLIFFTLQVIINK